MKTFVLLAGLVGISLFAFQTSDLPQQEKLAQARNLGKAFYENPTTQTQALDEFKKAFDLNPESARERVNYGLALLHAAKTAEGIAELEKAQKQDPTIPHTWFNLGIAYKKDSQYEKAIEQFEGIVKLVPNEPVSHYNLGVLYKLTGKTEDALREFELTAKLNPALAGPHFQLFNTYRGSGRPADAAREQAVFQEIKKRQAGAAVPEDLEWSFFSEIYDMPEAASAADVDAGKPVKLTARKLGDGFEGVTTSDVDGDGNPEIVAWSAAGVKVFKNGVAAAVECGLGGVRDVVSITSADFNNDALADLTIITKTGAELWINRKGKFEKSPIVIPEGHYAKAVWLDYDHDYDLDLFLLGEKSLLLRNNGAAGFSDETKTFPFVLARATDGTLFDAVPDTDGMDLVVTYADHVGVLYVDKLGGKYEAQDLAPVPAGVKSIHAMDLNNDAVTDLLIANVPVYHRQGTFQAAAPFASVLAGIDFSNSGQLSSAAGADAVSYAAVDFDGDGKTDVAAVEHDGSLVLLHNETE